MSCKGKIGIPALLIKNNAGYTFLEAILSLMVFIMIFSSLLLFFPWYEKSANSIMNTYSVEYEVFLSELRAELMDVVQVKALNSSTLELKKQDFENETNHTYSEYRYLSRRIVKTFVIAGGVDIKLTRLKGVQYKVKNNQIEMETDFANHTKKVRIIVYPK